MYDSVTKYLIETYTADYASWLLGKSISLSKLEPSELSLEPIRADSIVFLEGEDITLHIESQTRPNQDIFLRMLDYRIRLYRRSPSKVIKQVIIYLLPSSSPLVYQTSAEISGTSFKFEVIRLWEQPIEQFLNSPGLLPLATLAQTNDREQTLRKVALKIDALSDRGMQSTLSASTAILSALALEKNIIKQILRRDIMRESPMYQEILEEGKLEGIEFGILKGRQEGIEFGILKGRQEGIEFGILRGRQETIELVARNLLSIGMAPEQIATATGLSIEEVRKLQGTP